MGNNTSDRASYEIVHVGRKRDPSPDQAYYAQVREGNLEAHQLQVNPVDYSKSAFQVVVFVTSSPAIPRVSGKNIDQLREAVNKRQEFEKNTRAVVKEVCEEAGTGIQRVDYLNKMPSFLIEQALKGAA